MTDFFTWCGKYVEQAYCFVEYYERNYDNIWCFEKKEEYLESLKIIRQYEVLQAAVSDELNEYLQKHLVRNEYPSGEARTHKLNELYECWTEICFPKTESSIKTVDSLRLGKTIKCIRKRLGFSIAKVAGLLNISEASLRAYENGKALVRVDVLYGLSQIYKMDITKIIEESNPQHLIIKEQSIIAKE